MRRSELDMSDRGPRLTDEAARELVDECCEHAVSALVAGRDIDSVYEARFVTAASADHPHNVVLEIRNAVELHPDRRYSCNVCFVRRGRTWLFCSLVRDYLETHDPPRLILTMPKVVAGSDRRQAVRMSVTSDDLAVSVAGSSGGSWPLQPVNLSLGGMMLEAGPDAPMPAQNDRLNLELTTRRQSVEVPVVVTHCEGRRFGVSFEQHDDQHVLKHVMEQLQQRWLQSQRKQQAVDLPARWRVLWRHPEDLAAHVLSPCHDGRVTELDGRALVIEVDSSTATAQALAAPNELLEPQILVEATDPQGKRIDVSATLAWHENRDDPRRLVLGLRIRGS